MDEPTEREWEALHKAAIEFKEAAPWRWIDNEQVLAVVDSRTGETGFCSVLGSAGEEFGLGVYIGSEGYRKYLDIVSGDSPETFVGANCHILSMLFSNREELSQKDIAIIRSLGLHFRGKNAWPLFRSQPPYYAPWYLEKAEALYLEEAIRQTLEIVPRVARGELDLSEKRAEGLVFTRFCHNGEWQGQWRRPPSLKTRETEQTVSTDEESLLLEIRDSMGEPEGAWDMDIFVAPLHIKSESGRPYYPLMILAVDRQEGVILTSPEVVEPWLTPKEERLAVVKAMVEAGHIPRYVWTLSERTKGVIKPMAEKLGIELVSGRTPMLNKAKKALLKHLGY